MRPLTTKRVLLALLCLLLAACADEPLTRGYVPDEDQLAQIKPGVQDRDAVEKMLGSPSSVGTFEDNIWYYVTRHTEKFAFFQEEVKDQQVVAIVFDKSGVVSDVRHYNLADARDVEPVDRQTPTRGREMTIFEQLLGNIGRFSRGNDSGGK